MTEFEELPEGCISAILSHTTPADVNGEVRSDTKIKQARSSESEKFPNRKY